MQLKNRLDAHFASAAAVALGVAVLGAAPDADAAVVWSGIVNINIPSTSDGVYVNLVTGQSATSGSAVAGWHINPFGTNSMGFFGAPGTEFIRAGGSSATLVDNLSYLTTVGPTAASAFGLGNTGVESTGSTAMILNSSENLIGFRFLNSSTGGTHYGWMRIQFTGTSFSQPRAIVEYAYENAAGVGIDAGAIPAPGALALLAAAGFIVRRRRR